MPINENNIAQMQKPNLDNEKILNNNEKLESTIVIKVNENHKKILENHFKNEKGLALSSGIRQIIFIYMKKMNLI